MKLLLPFLAFWISTTAWAQIRIEGKIVDNLEAALPFTQVTIENTQLTTATNETGTFSLTAPESGTYTLIISHVGFATHRRVVEIRPGRSIQVGTIRLQPSNTSLEEVVVTGKTLAVQQEEQPIVVDVLDLSKHHQKSSSITQLLNLSSGIKVRQASGVGSETSVNINGMQDKAVRFFRDGVPTDYLGRAFQLSLIPVGNLDRVEVYKGVLPTELGSDALGGAINLVSRNLSENQLNFSYTIGSFNSHEFSLQSYLNLFRKKAYFSTSSYYVRSDNNYWIDAKIVDRETSTWQPVRVRRFHDAVGSLYLSGKVGLTANRFLDKAEAEAGVLRYQSDLQHNLYMSRPYGEARLEEKLFQTNVLLAKKIQNKLDLQLFAAYSRENNYLTDTSRNDYNWLGEIIPPREGESSVSGEINNRPALQTLNYHTLYSRFLGSSALRENHTLEFSHNLQRRTRHGENPLGEKIVGTHIDPLTIRATYFKNISGIGLKSTFFNQKLTNVFTVKYYSIATSGVDMDYNYDEEPLKTSESNLGFANSVKYSFTDDAFVRVSFERATRIPDAEEYFGDGYSTRGNLELLPEQSYNLNVGGSVLLSRKTTNKIDINFFYRTPENVVVIIPWLPFARYENWSKARKAGIEFSNSGRILPGLRYAWNVTYQDLKRTGIKNSAEQSLLNARLPNIPFFFGNATLDYQLQSVLTKNDKINLYGNYFYTLQYYLQPVPKVLEASNVFVKPRVDAETFLIPTQHVIDAGATYVFAPVPLSLNVELNNVLDAKVYDKLRVQKPGRNFRIKLLYTLK